MNGNPGMNRRSVLRAMAAGAALSLPLAARAAKPRLPAPPAASSPEALARDERFWADVAA